MCAYLQLCRFPAVFTALADILLGFALVHAGVGDAVELRKLAWLLVASAGLYLAGMVFNDVFDRRRDAMERPGRPIPSGRVSLRGAIVFGTFLVAAGLTAAAMVSTISLQMAGLLTLCVFAYDGLLKRTPLGPVFMGGCRFLNVLLGASGAAMRFVEPWDFPQVYIAASLGIYIVGVTWFARSEASRSSRLSLGAAAIIINAGIGALIVLEASNLGPLFRWSGAGHPQAVLLLLGCILLSIDLRVIAALLDPAPAKVQRGVRTMLLSLITLDAALIYAKLGPDGVSLAIITVLLLVPAMFLGRWIMVT